MTPPCPLCDKPLVLPEGAEVSRIHPNGKVSTRHTCACGVEAYVAEAADGSGPFVMMFIPNRPLKVRVVR